MFPRFIQSMARLDRFLTRFLILLFALTCFIATDRSVRAQDAQWIWSAEYPASRAPIGEALFRRTIQLTSLEQATIGVAADDAYELFVNGRSIGKGQSTRNLDQYDITQYLGRGRNVIAIRAENRNGTTAAVVAQLQVKQPNQEWRNFSSDSQWKSSIEPARNWQSVAYNDQDWIAARPLGKFGQTAPWDRANQVAQNSDSPSSDRFVAPTGFVVDQLLTNEQTGSLIAMAFNEFGHIVASQEGGPLLLIFDSDKDGTPDKVRTYCELVKNIQGILPLNGDVYVTGLGPDGEGLYRLTDEDRNGALEKSTKLIGFQGQSGEHGAHQIALGPDGMLYVAIGNHAQVDAELSKKSPYQAIYEGDLPQPRYEDPGGHARGIKAPGGTIVRCNLSGEHVERVAGGIRNAYDLAFHPNGSLFLHDSDMEADLGTTWYRPTTVFDVSAGAELGWRSGWAQWPEYYPDRIPSLLETGRGSPTGAVFYDHYAFPTPFQRNLFLADWSEGRILAVSLKPDGASFTGQAAVFLKGQPLNVTDLDVGQDGGLYFSTGGRGTDGGIYRVRWTGSPPPDLKNLGTGIAKAIRHPPMAAAWARQSLAMLKKELGEAWDEQVAGVAFSPDNPARYRVRALDLMQLLGPVPSTDLLVELSRSPNEAVRAKAAQLLGLQNEDAEAISRLQQMLEDSDRMVQRQACESLRRCSGQCDPKSLIPLLSSNDRVLAFAAMRLLETIEPNSWREPLLAHPTTSTMIQASLALLNAHPGKENAKLVIQAASKRMEGFLSDRDFLDILRVAQVAVHRGALKADDIAGFREQISGEFPAGEPIINRELIRLAVYLQSEDILERAIAYIHSDAPTSERVHVAMHLRFLKHAWTSSELFQVMRFMEEAMKEDGGSSYQLYLMQVTSDLSSSMTLDDAKVFVSQGAQWPNAALAGLRKFPERLSSSDFATLKQLDQSIDQSGLEADYYKRLKTGITAILARSGDDESMSYLREAWRRSPDRRAMIALGLSLKPEGENWDYLVRSIPLLDAFAVPDVLNQLRKVPIAPDDAEAIRQVIVLAIRMKRDQENNEPAIQLLQHWTGKNLSSSHADMDSQLKAWQSWFRETYPDHLDPVLPDGQEAGKWTPELVNEYLDGDKSKIGSIEDGRLAFAKAKCDSCHKMGRMGTSMGPDLTTLSKRFNRQETLEAILFPSHVISDQYRSQRILTLQGDVIVGLVSKSGDGSLRVRKSDLTETIVPEEDIDEMSPSKISVMPSGLLDSLQASEIRDLFCFLGYVPAEQLADKSESNRR